MPYYITVCKFWNSEMYCKSHYNPLNAWLLYWSAKWLSLYNAFHESLYQNTDPLCVPFHHGILPVIFVKHTFESSTSESCICDRNFCINYRFWYRVWRAIKCKLSDSRLQFLNNVSSGTFYVMESQASNIPHCSLSLPVFVSDWYNVKRVNELGNVIACFVVLEYWKF
jgi:hypothetical protein